MGRHAKFQVGYQVDLLTVVEFKKIGPKLHAICRCGCGNTITLRYEALRNKVNSCGCRPGPLWKGHGDLSATHYGAIRKGANSRGLAFEVTIEDLWKALENQKHRCKLSGLPIHLGTTVSSRRSASVDRIDSTRGYLPDNIQWVHKDINLMKQQYDQEHFINLCARVTAYQQGKPLPDPESERLETPKPRRGRKLPDYARKGWNTRRPKLSLDSILADVVEYFTLYGRYPTCLDKNPVPNKPEESWSNYDQNLRTGKRGLPGGSSLFRTIEKYKAESQAQPPARST